MNKDIWEFVDFDDLPRSAKDLGDAIGKEAALLLLQYLAGKRIYVPEKFKEEHKLLQLIGETAFALLIDRFGRNYLTIPPCLFALQKAKTRKILEENGRSQSSLQLTNGGKRKPRQKTN